MLRKLLIACLAMALPTLAVLAPSPARAEGVVRPLPTDQFGNLYTTPSGDLTIYGVTVYGSPGSYTVSISYGNDSPTAGSTYLGAYGVAPRSVASGGPGTLNGSCCNTYDGSPELTEGQQFELVLLEKDAEGVTVDQSNTVVATLTSGPPPTVVTFNAGPVHYEVDSAPDPDVTHAISTSIRTATPGTMMTFGAYDCEGGLLVGTSQEVPSDGGGATLALGDGAGAFQDGAWIVLTFQAPGHALLDLTDQFRPNLGGWDFDVCADPVRPSTGTVANTAVPTISGVPRVGVRLTASPGSWTPSDGSYGYQWLADSAVIPGATGSSYVPTAAYRGQKISVRVTASKAGYASATKTSAQTAVVAAGIIRNRVLPTVSGTPKVGQTLTARPGSWSPSGLTFRYQWFKGTTAVRGATARTFRLPAGVRGMKVRVRVTAVRAGYTSLAKYSTYSGRVR